MPASSRSTQRKPMWLVPVSTVSDWRAAGGTLRPRARRGNGGCTTDSRWCAWLPFQARAASLCRVMFHRWTRKRLDPGELGRRRPSFPGSGLHVCNACRAPFVHPITRSRLDASRWSMLLRCGECGHERDLVVGDQVAARYEDDLREAARAIAQALAEEDRKRLEREAEAFAAALDRDLIDAADFAAAGSHPLRVTAAHPGAPDDSVPHQRRCHGDE